MMRRRLDTPRPILADRPSVDPVVWLRISTLGICALLLSLSGAQADELMLRMIDPPLDTVARRTDTGPDDAFDADLLQLIDLREITVAPWSPDDPEVDLFTGIIDEQGLFFRLDIVVDGLVSPPGSLDATYFDPFAFGDNPIYGFVEIDMDDDEDTGGELDAPEFRYLGNIARFGGQPLDSVFEDRIAEDGSAFDGDFETKPYVERSGEEFHLALLHQGYTIHDIVHVIGNGDAVFETGETWDVPGQWFHRAHGYERFSLAGGGGRAGEYTPHTILRFQHDENMDQTIITLVFPLTNEGAARALGALPQPNNHDPTDQASLFEAFDDLVVSAELLENIPSGKPEELLIIDWAGRNPEYAITPVNWRFTALFGTSYASSRSGNAFFVWTDTFPNATRGEVDGEDGSSTNDDPEEADDGDRDEIAEYIEQHDADDGIVDGMVIMVDFARNFSVYDINYDGVVDNVDILLVSAAGDCDGDGDVDLADFACLQNSFTGESEKCKSDMCHLSDLDTDNDVDLRDLVRFLRASVELRKTEE